MTVSPMARRIVVSSNPVDQGVDGSDARRSVRWSLSACSAIYAPYSRRWRTSRQVWMGVTQWTEVFTVCEYLFFSISATLLHCHPESTYLRAAGRLSVGGASSIAARELHRWCMPFRHPCPHYAATMHACAAPNSSPRRSWIRGRDG